MNYEFLLFKYFFYRFISRILILIVIYSFDLTNFYIFCSIFINFFSFKILLVRKIVQNDNIFITGLIQINTFSSILMYGGNVLLLLKNI